MPTVPTYQPQQGNVQNLPGVKLQAFDTSAGTNALARGAQAVGGALGQIAEQEREKADIAALLDADRRLSAWETSTLYAPETGLLNRKGKDALGIPDEAMPAFDKLQSEIEGGLNERARLRFRQMAQGRRSDVERQLGRHVAAQSNVILEQETAAYEATALQAIAAHAGDPERLAAEKDRLWIAKAAALDRLGAGPETIKAERQRVDGLATAAVIDSFMARGQYMQASEYFKANREALGVKADEYAAKVKEADLQMREIAESDRILAAHPGAGPAAIREAAKIDDPFLRERVEVRIDREAARNERLRNEYDRGVRRSLLEKVELGQDLTPDERVAAAGVPGLTEALDVRSRQIAEGVQPVTDDVLWYQLVDEANNNPTAFAKRDLMQYRPKLDDAKFSELVRAQGGAEQRAEAGMLRTAEITKKAADVALGTRGLDPSPQRKEQTKEAQRVAAYRKALDSQVSTWRAANGGKEPPLPEIQKMADELLMPWKQTTPDGGWFYFDKVEDKFAFEAPKPPRDAAQRVAGQVYATPRGALEWTGTGWRPLQETE